MLEVRDRSLPPCGPRDMARVADEDLPIAGELITEDDLADEIDEGWDEEDPVVKQLFDDLVRGEHAKAVMAEAEMRRVIELNQSLEHRFIDGLGQLVARIPMSVYLHWAAVHGHEFWAQDDSLDFLAKRAGGGRGNPGLLIETKGRATIIKTEEFPQSRTTAAVCCGGDSAAAGGSPAAATAVPHSARKVRGRRGRWAA